MAPASYRPDEQDSESWLLNSARPGRGVAGLEAVGEDQQRAENVDPIGDGLRNDRRKRGITDRHIRGSRGEWGRVKDDRVCAASSDAHELRS